MSLSGPELYTLWRIIASKFGEDAASQATVKYLEMSPVHEWNQVIKWAYTVAKNWVRDQRALHFQRFRQEVPEQIPTDFTPERHLEAKEALRALSDARLKKGLGFPSRWTRKRRGSSTLGAWVFLFYLAQPFVANDPRLFKVVLPTEQDCEAVRDWMRSQGSHGDMLADYSPVTKPCIPLGTEPATFEGAKRVYIPPFGGMTTGP